MAHRYPADEYDRVEGAPLSPSVLARIWAGLPEKERLGFVLSLDEAIADRVIELCKSPAQSGRETQTNDCQGA